MLHIGKNHWLVTYVLYNASFTVLDIAKEKWGKGGWGGRVSVPFCGTEGYLDFVSDAFMP